jgi:dedicator of cytokinesis protein 3
MLTEQYRGLNWEQIGAFCDRIKKQYDCPVVTSNAPLDEAQIRGPGKGLQICALHPAADKREWKEAGQSPGGLSTLLHSSLVPEDKAKEFTYPPWLLEPELYSDLADLNAVKAFVDDIPPLIGSYYENNELSLFTCSRPIRKRNPALNDHPAREFLELYTEKILLVSEERFPCRSRRSRVKQLITFELKPIENAIIAVYKKSRQLQAFLVKYSNSKLASSSSPEKRSSLTILREKLEHHSFLPPTPPTQHDNVRNANPFTMALKGAIDAPVNGGIPMYRSAFLGKQPLCDASLDQRRDLSAAITDHVIRPNI